MKKLYLILQNLIYITYLAELLPLLLFLIFLNKIKSTEIRVFFLYSITFTLFLVLNILLKFFLNDSIHLLTANRFFLLSEFTFLAIYYNYILTFKHKKYLFLLFTIAFFLYSFYDFYTSVPGKFSYVPLVFESLFFLLVIVYFFYEKLQFSVTSPIYFSPNFWISVAFLIYFSGNFFIFLFVRSMVNDPNFRNQYTIIYGTVTIIKNIFLCTAVIANKELVSQQQMEAKPIDIDLGSFNPIKKSL